jgi:hypothetical protein
MILGMSIQTFTTLHVILSLIGIVMGLWSQPYVMRTVYTPGPSVPATTVAPVSRASCFC